MNLKIIVKKKNNNDNILNAKNNEKKKLIEINKNELFIIAVIKTSLRKNKE